MTIFFEGNDAWKSQQRVISELTTGLFCYYCTMHNMIIFVFLIIVDYTEIFFRNIHLSIRHTHTNTTVPEDIT